MAADWRFPPVQTGDRPLKVAASVADLKKGVGSYALAVVAPKEGPIQVKEGTPVILVVKKFWESPTIRRLWQAICIAWGAFWTYVIGTVIVAGGPFSLTEDQWIKLLKDASYPALVSIGLAYGIQQKKRDNDPVKS